MLTRKGLKARFKLESSLKTVYEKCEPKRWVQAAKAELTTNEQTALRFYIRVLEQKGYGEVVAPALDYSTSHVAHMSDSYVTIYEPVVMIYPNARWVVPKGSTDPVIDKAKSGKPIFGAPRQSSNADRTRRHKSGTRLIVRLLDLHTIDMSVHAVRLLAG